MTQMRPPWCERFAQSDECMKDAYVADALIMLAVPFRLPVDCQCEVLRNSPHATQQALSTALSSGLGSCACAKTTRFCFCKNNKRTITEKKTALLCCARDARFWGECTDVLPLVPAQLGAIMQMNGYLPFIFGCFCKNK